MNWAQFKDPTFHICLAGTVVLYWSLTQEVEGSEPFYCNDKYFVPEFAAFSETFRKNSIALHCRCFYQQSVCGRINIEKLLILVSVVVAQTTVREKI